MQDKTLKFNRLGDRIARAAIDLEMRYDAWVSASRVVRQGRLAWSNRGGREYLYCYRSRGNTGSSLGPRSPDTEKRYEEFLAAKKTVENAGAILTQDAAVYRALNAPMISSYAAPILQEIDLEAKLGTDLLVVGTHALTVYAIEAGHAFPDGTQATEDFDMTWVRAPGRSAAPPIDTPLFYLLKQIDDTFTVNTERTFQARNSAGEEVELLMAESGVAPLPKGERLRPIALPEQDWLLPGQRISHVVTGYDGTPARVVAPDPRWFALHKLWLSQKPTRDRRKAPKDRDQGIALLWMVKQHMPHIPLDDAFAETVPAELAPFLSAWRAGELH